MSFLGAFTDPHRVSSVLFGSPSAPSLSFMPTCHETAPGRSRTPVPPLYKGLVVPSLPVGGFLPPSTVEDGTSGVYS